MGFDSKTRLISINPQHQSENKGPGVGGFKLDLWLGFSLLCF